MVCPNCHSDNIIEVQGQHFCINCGQALPQAAIEANGVQADGLPLGVKILPASGIPSATIATATAPANAPAKISKATKSTQSNAPEVKAAKPPQTNPADNNSSTTSLIVKSRSRIRVDSDEQDSTGQPDGTTPDAPVTQDAPETPANPKPEAKPVTEIKLKKRKPGRPKSGPLDVPRPSVAATAPALPEAPQLGKPKLPAPAPVPSPIPPTPATPKPADAPLEGPRRMSDIAPRKTSHKPRTGHSKAASALTEKNSQLGHTTESTPQTLPKTDHKRKRRHKALFLWPKHQPKRHHVHKVGVPSLHFGAVMKFSLRASARPRHLGLASLAAISFATAVGYGVWLFLTLGPNRLVAGVQHPAPNIIAQLLGLAALFYVGRSVGQAALTFGVAREADQRPVPLSKQLGVGINTFGRHLATDLLYGVIQIALLGAVAILIMTGGQTWPINIQLQMGALFVAFLLLLYLLAAMTITRGLAGVAITLTSERPKTAIKLGWRLFSHRFELLGLRFLAAAVELLAAVPLAVLAVAFVTAAPGSLKLAVTFGVTVIAWLAGALIGAGSAAWWAALYRQLVLADQSDRAVNLLSSRQATDANRGPLALIVSISTLLVVAVLALPWVKL